MVEVLNYGLNGVVVKAKGRSITEYAVHLWINVE